VARGNRHWGRIFLALLLVVIVLVVAADRIGVVVAERQLAKQARTQLAAQDITTTSDPVVTIGGFPFLTQVLSGEYGKITIALTNPTSKGIRLDSVDVTATDVNAPLSTIMKHSGQVEADKVSGVATLNWASFQQLVDLSAVQKYGIDPDRLHISGSAGKVTISAPVSLLGRTFTLLATGTVAVSSNIVHVTITNVSAQDGGIPSFITQQLQGLREQLSFSARIPALPYHLSIDGVSTSSAGVAITASARNVTLAG